MMDTNYLCEQKLKRENPQLHKRVADSVVCVERMLVKYQNIFPTYTDHTALHSINIIDFCNRLIGKNIDQMNADEIYVLLMGAYLHDSGMGITMSDYENFQKKLTSEIILTPMIRRIFQILSGISIRNSVASISKSTQRFLIYRHRNIFLRSYRLHGDTEKQICGIQKNIRRKSAFQTEIRFICPIWQP